MKDKIKILIVDDEKIIRDMLSEHLSDEGFLTVAAESGEEALALYEADPLHLVITDIRMGGMSGVQLLEEIKKRDDNAVVVMITSHASLDSAVATLRAGAYDYIFKPFEDLDQVTQVVNRAMDKIALIHQNRQLIEDLERSNMNMELANEMLRELATRDGLTGLFNYRHFKEILEKEVVRSTRYQRPLCLVMLDVDHFKAFNDAHGHPAGDEVLKALADILKARLRGVDTCARYGGEEFVFLLPETDGKEGREVAEAIRVQVENQAFRGHDGREEAKVTVSLGVAEYPADADSPAALLEKADNALYQAKTLGRNRTCCVSDPA